MNALRYLCSLVWVSAQGLPRRIYRRLVPAPLTPEQSEFVKLNAAFWQMVGTEERQSTAHGYVLVPVARHPVIQLCDASFASIVGHACKLRPLFVVTEGRKAVSTRLLRSYPGAAFIYLSSWSFPLKRLWALCSALRTYRTFKSPKDLLDFRLDGIRFGDALYDAVLGLGYATLDRIDARVLEVLWEFYFLRAFFLAVINKYPVRTSVFAHTVGLHGSTFSRYLLRAGIGVLNRMGSHQLILKRYRRLAEVGIYPMKPELRYFRLMLEGNDGTIQRRAEEYLERRFNQQVQEPVVALAFNAGKAVYSDRPSFCSAYGLRPDRPIVFVMLHAFNDYPHSHFAKPMLFQDYYCWFRRTLEIAEETPHVNWIFKEHPESRYYTTRDVDLHQIFAGVKAKHVRFLEADADFNARSIRDLAHVIVTCLGTAGLEYATCGIPCVLAGESAYSGLGFTREPETAEAYEQCLRHIERLPPLTADQVVAAKLTAYFYFCVRESTQYLFCPKFTDAELSKWNDELTTSLWKEAGAQLRDPEHVERLRVQAEELGRFTLDSMRTQYVDLRQFPLFAGGVAGDSAGGRQPVGERSR